jgi:hypothetical protein
VRRPYYPPPQVDPASAVHAYYGALEARDFQEAYRHWGVTNASYSQWEREFARNATCSMVRRATTISHYGNAGSADVDICLGDAKRGVADHWVGTIDAYFDGSAWKMSKWNVRRSGTCASDCSR